MGFKVYLSGDESAWRNGIYPHLDVLPAGHTNLTELWPEKKNALFGEHDYVGPFRSIKDGPVIEVASMKAGGCQRQSETEPGQHGRRCYLHAQFDAIARANVVFMWVTAEAMTCFAELGWALSKQTFIIFGLSPYMSRILPSTGRSRWDDLPMYHEYSPVPAIAGCSDPKEALEKGLITLMNFLGSEYEQKEEGPTEQDKDMINMNLGAILQSLRRGEIPPGFTILTPRGPRKRQ